MILVFCTLGVQVKLVDISVEVWRKVTLREVTESLAV